MNYSISVEVNPDANDRMPIGGKKLSIEIGHANFTPTGKVSIRLQIPGIASFFRLVRLLNYGGKMVSPQIRKEHPMKTHISLNVRDVQASVAFYQMVFGVAPQKQAGDYAKFDLTTPPLNFSLISAPTDISRVNHLGVEVDSANELTSWEHRLQELGLVNRIERDVDCCFARQNKLWFTDPDGNHWEVFTVLEQLPVTMALNETGCCVPSNESTRTNLCGCP